MALPFALAAGLAWADEPLAVTLAVEAAGGEPTPSLVVTLTDSTPCADAHADAELTAYDAHVCRAGGTDDKPTITIDLTIASTTASGAQTRRRAKFELRAVRGGTAKVNLNETKVGVTLR